MHTHKSFSFDRFLFKSMLASQKLASRTGLANIHFLELEVLSYFGFHM